MADKQPMRPIRYYLLHARWASVGLVVLTIFVTVVMYAQTGLLLHDPEPLQTFGQTAESTANLDKAAITPPDPQLEEQQPVDDEKPIDQPQENPDQATKTLADTSSCDQRAELTAKQLYDRSLTEEMTAHKKRLASISDISRLMHTVTLGMTANNIEAENNRHKAAEEKIQSTYQQSLATAGCQDQSIDRPKT